MKKTLTYLIGLVFFSAAAFFGAKTYTDNMHGKPNLVSGKSLYDTNCSICHGTRGLGDGVAASSLAISPDNIYEEIINPLGFKYELINSVLEGDNGQEGSMPAFNTILTEKDVNDILEYIRNTNQPTQKLDLS